MPPHEIAAPARCVVIGGAGAVGAMFADELHRSGADVCVVDSRVPAGRPGIRAMPGDVTDISPRLASELLEADLVLLAVPEPVAIAALLGVAGTMRRGALLMDTLSVKGRIADAAKAIPGRVEMLSVNPMFAPSLGITGRPVAAVTVHDGPRCAHMVRLLETWGARVVLMTAEHHDRLAGASQALTHAAIIAFGLALSDLDAEITDLTAIAPPPHATMLAMLARITSGTPEVYWDVQTANPHAPAARKALASAVRRFAETIEHGDEAGFAGLLHRLRDRMGKQLKHHRDACARAFQAL